MFSYVSLEQRVPQDHPLRAIRKLTDGVLRSLNSDFDALYAETGRPSIAPEYLLRALLLQVFYSIRSEGLLVEQIDYNLLFRWFVGLGMDDAIWEHSVFSKNRDRLLTSAVAQRFFAEVNRRAKKFMSDEHFTVDGTLIQAWASQKSFRPKDGGKDGFGDGTDFHGQKRSNETHESTTDTDARLYKKSYGKESKLSYLGHALVENRNGLIAAAMVTHADGYAERDAAHHRGRGQGLRQQGFRRHGAGVERDSTCDQERQRPAQQPRPPHHQAPRLCHQPEPPMAGRKGLCMAEANRSSAPGQVTRVGECGLAVRLQLRGTQPAPTASAHRATTIGKAPGAVRLKHDQGSRIHPRSTRKGL